MPLELQAKLVTVFENYPDGTVYLTCNMSIPPRLWPIKISGRFLS